MSAGRMLGAALAVGGCVLSPMSASAFNFEPPGFTTGLPVYAQFPTNLYLIDVPQYGVRNSNPSFDLAAETPFFFYASPWKLLGAQVNFQFAPTLAFSRTPGTPVARGFYNNYLGAGLSWDLGNGWFGGVRMSGWTPIKSDEGYNFGGLDERFGITYLKDGIDFTANFAMNQPVESGPATEPTSAIVDLTLTKKFGKWELGGVGFGSTDLSQPFPTYVKQRQFALGPLVGYDFGPVNVQLKATSDVAETGYGGRDRRIWANIIVPLFSGTPTPPPAPISARY